MTVRVIARGRTAHRARRRWVFSWPSIGRATLVRALPFAAIVVLAFALRLAVIPSSLTLDLTPLVVDEREYLPLAQAIAAGEPIPDRWPWVRSLGYPVLLAAILRLSGGDPHAPFPVQAAIGAATVALVATLAGQLWGRRAALLAALLAALDPSLVLYTTMLHTEVPYIALLFLLTYALVRYEAADAEAARWRWLALAGVSAGLAATMRPPILSTLALVLAWLAWLAHRRGGSAFALRQTLLFAGCCAALIAPMTLSHWRTHDRFILLDTALAFNVWRDHRDPSLDLIDLDTILRAVPNPGDRGALALREGLAWAAAHPAETLVGAFQGVRTQWGTSVYVYDAFDKRPGFPDAPKQGWETLALITWLVIVALAIVALCHARQGGPLVPAVLIAVVGPSITVAVSHPDGRFTLPSWPILLALAAGVAAPATAVMTRRRVVAAGAGVALFLALIAGVSGPLFAASGPIGVNYALGQLAERAGWGTAATTRYEAIVRSAPWFAEPRVRLGALARASGDDAAALAWLEGALQRDPHNPRAHALRSAIFRAQGRDDEVRRVAAQGVAASESLAWAWANEDVAPPARLLLDGTDSGFARGFHWPERGEEGRDFRWMRDRAQLRLQPPGGETPLQLRIVLASPRQPHEPPVVVTVSVNGSALGQAALRREYGWNEVRFALPPDLDRTRPLTIELRAPTTRLPPDPRIFGAAVSEAAIEAAR